MSIYADIAWAAEEIERLRAENERLRAEVEQLRAEADELRQIREEHDRLSVGPKP